jgi:hypothetical protein
MVASTFSACTWPCSGRRRLRAIETLRFARVPRGVKSPSETIYQAEHYPILRSWLSDDTTILPQCNIPLLSTTDSVSRLDRQRQSSALHVDTVIMDDLHRFVLEYVATENEEGLAEHFERVMTHCRALKASEALVVHFTIVESSDKYRFVYPSSSGEDGVKVQAVHIYHNAYYTQVKLYTREQPDPHDGEWLQLP